MKTATVLLALFLAVPGAGNAATLAECRGAAPAMTGLPWNPSASFQVACHVGFTLGGAREVTITLRPLETFTGTLEGNLRTPGPPPEGQNVKGVFVRGQLVAGQSARTLPLRAGTWEFEVKAGNVPPCLPFPPPPNTPSCPVPYGFAVGDFGGEVTG